MPVAEKKAHRLVARVSRAEKELLRRAATMEGRTLAGFLLAQLGHIPTVGESIDYECRRFQVAEMAGRRISRVIVEDIAPPQGPVDKVNSGEATQ